MKSVNCKNYKQNMINCNKDLETDKCN